MPLIPPKPLVEIEKRKTQQQPVPMAKGGTIDVGVPEIPEIGAFAGSGQIGELATPSVQRDIGKSRVEGLGITPDIMDVIPLTDPAPIPNVDDYISTGLNPSPYPEGLYNTGDMEAYLSTNPYTYGTPPIGEIGPGTQGDSAVHEVLHHLEQSLTPQEFEELKKINESYPVDRWHTSTGGILGPSLTVYWDNYTRLGIPPPEEVLNLMRRVASRLTQPQPIVGFAKGGSIDVGVPYIPEVGEFAGMGNIAPPTPESDLAQYGQPYLGPEVGGNDQAAENYIQGIVASRYEGWSDFLQHQHAAIAAGQSAMGMGQPRIEPPPNYIADTLQGQGDMRYGPMSPESYTARGALQAKTLGLDPWYAYLAPINLNEPQRPNAAAHYNPETHETYYGPGVANYGYKSPGVFLHEQTHAFEDLLTPGERETLAALMHKYPTLASAGGLGREEYHPGGLTRYFDQIYNTYGSGSLDHNAAPDYDAIGFNRMPPSREYFPDEIAEYINSILPAVLERARER